MHESLNRVKTERVFGHNWLTQEREEAHRAGGFHTILIVFCYSIDAATSQKEKTEPDIAKYKRKGLAEMRR